MFRRESELEDQIAANQLDNNGKTPLEAAASSGNFNSMSDLLGRGADPFFHPISDVNHADAIFSEVFKQYRNAQDADKEQWVSAFFVSQQFVELCPLIISMVIRADTEQLSQNDKLAWIRILLENKNIDLSKEIDISKRRGAIELPFPIQAVSVHLKGEEKKEIFELLVRHGADLSQSEYVNASMHEKAPENIFSNEWAFIKYGRIMYQPLKEALGIIAKAFSEPFGFLFTPILILMGTVVLIAAVVDGLSEIYDEISSKKNPQEGTPQNKASDTANGDTYLSLDARNRDIYKMFPPNQATSPVINPAQQSKDPVPLQQQVPKLEPNSSQSDDTAIQARTRCWGCF